MKSKGVKVEAGLIKKSHCQWERDWLMTLFVIFYPCHVVRAILSVPFCPIPFCPYTILSVPFCPYHFVRTILSVPFCPLPFCPRTVGTACSPPREAHTEL